MPAASIKLIAAMSSLVNIFSAKQSDRICLVVYGNIASGKTTLSKNIQALLPGFNYVCLDDIRLQWVTKFPAMNGITRERQCEDECLKQILQSRLLIYETTGATLFFNRIKSRLKGHFKTFYIKVDCPVITCLYRFENRKAKGYKCVAPAFKLKMNMHQTLCDIDDKHYAAKVDLQLDSERLSQDEMLLQVKEFFNFQSCSN